VIHERSSLERGCGRVFRLSGGAGAGWLRHRTGRADNATDEEKNCAVKCQVDTKIGVVQASCGGNTPPRAKDHSLCDFDKPDRYYNKIVSQEDSCKAQAGAAPPKAAAVAPAKPNFACRISADGTAVEAVMTNPYKSETSCQIDCQLSTTRTGTTFSVSCTKSVDAGAVDAVLCTQNFDKGKLVKMIGGKGSCIDQSAAAEKDKDDDEEIDVQSSPIQPRCASRPARASPRRRRSFSTG
jgi:hypothetical protein